VNDGIVLVSAEEVMRDPMKNVPTDAPNSIPELTEQQRQVLSVLSGELSKHLDAARPEQVVSVGARALAMVPAGTVTEKVDYRETHKQTAGNEVIPWLLHGVTGSGKTEIYLRLIDQTLKAGRTALLLVPEISLTPQLAQRLKSRFGGKAAVWHSALSAGERYDTWRRLRSGDVRVLLGARSAVLASMPELALIVVDEEHDGSYKQASPSPRYNAKQLVLEKAKRTGALVVLGSATPDVATFYEADRNNRILELPERVFKQEMPRVSVVDMRDEFANNNRGIFSLLLKQRLAACLERKEQAILLMNRRGFASHVFCRACGYVVKCRNCSVSLVFHQPGGEESSYLSCHHCGYHCSSVQICPSCKSPFLKHYGLGTQRVEQEVQKFFPEASHLRLDSDVTVKKGAYQQVLGKFAQGDADILIGTQMVAKGLDISNVTLVGVLAADAAFNLPDYRSLERGFQLLTQVSGRAGRGDRPGTVVLQTFNTDLPALNWARKHDYASFYAEEITARTELGYPPFSQITRCVVSGPDPISVQRSCEELAEQLTHYLEEEVDPHLVTILGPAPCLIERMRGNYRYHLLIKNFAGDAGHRLITTFLRTKRVGQNNSLAVDVDAFDLL
jgi:primosomal protein N' (replication factor Y)